MQWFGLTSFCLCLIASLLLGSPALPQAKIAVDLELVLAVDISSSMDEDEQRLQRDGYVDALRHPAIMAAINGGVHGRIALTYVEWGNIYDANVVLDWRILSTAEEVANAARQLAQAPIGRGQGTSISSALSLAANSIENNAYEGTRRVIDISGDGPNNVGPLVLIARQKVLDRGIEINGLPIIIKKALTGFQISDLDIYYEDCVIGGPSAFVIPVYDKARLAATILQKMMLEISGIGETPDRPVRLAAFHTSVRPQRRTPRIDCTIGEKQRDDFMRSLGFE